MVSLMSDLQLPSQLQALLPLTVLIQMAFFSRYAHDRHILQDRISRDNAAGTYKIHALPVNLQGGSQKVAHTSTQHTFGVVQDKHTHTHAHLMALLSWTTRVRWYQKGKTNLE